jgi:hypothetical protein
VVTDVAVTNATDFTFQKRIGALLLLIGFGISFSAWLIFLRRKTPLRPGQPPSSFVQSGPYRFTRNPMYLGMLIFLFGLFFAVRSWYFLIPPALFFVLINSILIPFEEELMHRTFGDPYDNYCRPSEVLKRTVESFTMRFANPLAPFPAFPFPTHISGCQRHRLGRPGTRHPLNRRVKPGNQLRGDWPGSLP